jgi:pre-rRNA-processing protein IPI1
VLAALAPRCSDGDKAVRGALQSLLRAAVLPGLGAGQVAPFMPLLMAHVGSALTHLEPAVRTDALALLDALMDTVPALLVGGAAPASDAAVGGAAAAAAAAAGSGSSYLGVCLTHFRDHLSRGVRGRSIKAQAIGPLAVTLGQLQRFLARAFPAAAAGGAPGGGEGPAAAVAGTAPDAGPAGGAAGDAGVRPLQACRAQAGRPADGLAHPQALLRLYCSPAEAAAWQLQQRHDRLASHAAASSSGGGRGPGSQPPKGRKAGAKAAASAPAPVAAAAAGGEGGPAAVSQGQAAALQLLDALWDCWAECAPATLSISPEEDSTQALVHILSCSHLLLTGMGLLPAPAAAAAAATGSALPAAWQVARPLQQNSAHVQAAARLVLPRLAPAFPAGCPAVGPPPAVQALLQRFNLLGAQLLAALLAAGAVWPPPQAAAAVAASEAAWASRLVGYVCLLLVHGDVVPSADALAPLTMAAGADLPAAGPSSRAAAGKPGAVTNATYLAALAAAQQVLPCLPHAERRRLLAAVKQLAAGVQPRSPVQVRAD